MTNRAYAAIAILISSLLLGVVGDSILRVGPWGPNIAVWVGIALVLAAAVALRLKLESIRNLAWTAPPAALFGAGLVVRDSSVLRVLNIFGLLSLFGIAFICSSSKRHLLVKVSDCVIVWMGWLFVALGKFFYLFCKDVPWQSLGTSEKAKEYKAAFIGVSIALPLVLIFGSLFISADAVFKSVTIDRLQIDAERVLSAIVLIPLFAWIGGAGLRQLLINEPDEPPIVKPEGYRLGKIELGIVLGSVVSLFMAFVLIQIGYLFGGDERVQKVAGLTYAEYARSGFFELVAATGIAIIVILSLQSLRDKEDKVASRLFMILSSAFVLELFVVLASASHRMFIYIRAYGLSELRFFIGAAIIWMFFVLIWLLATNWTKRSSNFAFGALASLYATIWLSSAANPDYQIVEYNLSMDRKIDVPYMRELSCDAAPALMKRLEALPKSQQGEAAYFLLQELVPTPTEDWRTLNMGRRRAAELVNARKPELEKLAKGYEPLECCNY